MLAFDANEASLAGSFLLGFTIGIFTAVRLLDIAVGGIMRNRRRIEQFTIDHPGTDAVETSEEGNPP